MKALVLLFCLGFTTLSIAAQVDTDCPAMNESREKIDKSVVKSKTAKTKQVSAQ